MPQFRWKSAATMNLNFLPDIKGGGASEVGGIGARGGRLGGGGSPESMTMLPPSASGNASMLISPLLNWSECLVARCDSRADLTLKRAGQNGQRLLMTCWCARNCPFLSLARVFWNHTCTTRLRSPTSVAIWVVIQWCREISQQ